MKKGANEGPLSIKVFTPLIKAKILMIGLRQRYYLLVHWLKDSLETLGQLKTREAFFPKHINSRSAIEAWKSLFQELAHNISVFHAAGWFFSFPLRHNSR